MRADRDFNLITPSEGEKDAITELVEHLRPWSQAERTARTRWRLVSPQDESRQLPPSVMDGLSAVVVILSKHDGAAVLPLATDLTTQEAADLLGVSRPHLIRLLEQGELPYHLVGKHRRIRAEDVIAYRRAQEQERRLALDALTEQSEQLGLYPQRTPSPFDELDRNDAENRTG
jgi:excisionase family DNA binding protein